MIFGEKEYIPDIKQWLYKEYETRAESTNSYSNLIQ